MLSPVSGPGSNSNTQGPRLVSDAAPFHDPSPWLKLPEHVSVHLYRENRNLAQSDSENTRGQGMKW